MHAYHARLQLIAEKTKDWDREARQEIAELEAHLRFLRLTICKDLLEMGPDAQREAIKELQSLIKDYPDSPEAKEAAKLLEGLNKAAKPKK
jgi:hypothetical protein